MRYFEGLGQDFEWKVYDHDQPLGLPERLGALGFAVGEAGAVLVLDLGEAPSILRLLGVIFLILSYYQRLPAVFAFPAAIGDMLAGATASIAARSLKANSLEARAVFLLWNFSGFADLILAVSLGLLASPVGLIQGPVSTVPMTTFLVPIWLIFHLACLDHVAYRSFERLDRSEQDPNFGGSLN